MLNIPPPVRPPSPESPVERITWDTSKQFWEQVAVPALSAFRAETLELIKGVDISLRTAESRMQTLADRFESKAEYLASKESEIGQLRASDEKQDQSIKDLWTKLNALVEQHRLLDNRLAIAENTQAGFKLDIYGEAASNTPGLRGTLREMKLDIMQELSNMKTQTETANRRIPELQAQLDAMKRRKGALARVRIWLLGE